MIGLGFLPNAFPVPEWRNWQTRETQNLVHLTVSVGSIPTSGTSLRSPDQSEHAASFGWQASTRKSQRPPHASFGWQASTRKSQRPPHVSFGWQALPESFG